MLVIKKKKKKKNLPANARTWKTPVWDLGQEDLLEGEMAPHSRILAGRILWIEVLGGSSVPKVVRHNWASENNRFNEFNLGKFIFRFSGWMCIKKLHSYNQTKNLLPLLPKAQNWYAIGREVVNFATFPCLSSTFSYYLWIPQDYSRNNRKITAERTKSWKAC